MLFLMVLEHLLLLLPLYFELQSRHFRKQPCDVSSCLYGSMLVLLYTMSTIYHALKRNRAKYVFRIFDHCTIFLLIAGTYIPIVLVGIGGAVGWIYFGIVSAAMLCLVSYLTQLV